VPCDKYSLYRPSADGKTPTHPTIAMVRGSPATSKRRRERPNRPDYRDRFGQRTVRISAAADSCSVPLRAVAPPSRRYGAGTDRHVRRLILELPGGATAHRMIHGATRAQSTVPRCHASSIHKTAPNVAPSWAKRHAGVFDNRGHPGAPRPPARSLMLPAIIPTHHDPDGASRAAPSGDWLDIDRWPSLAQRVIFERKTRPDREEISVRPR